MMRMLPLATTILAVLLPGMAMGQPATQPATQPAPMATTRPTAEITDDVRPLLEKVAEAYTQLQSLKMEGTITGEFDVLGRQRKEVKAFTAAYRAPLTFRHETSKDVQIGSTGEKLYAYTYRGNQYVTETVPAEKQTFDKMPSSIGSILSFQNPTLAIALSTDPVHELTDNVTDLTRRPDVAIDGKDHPVLHLALSGGDSVEMRFDPETHLMRQAVFDLRPGMEKRGAVDVKQARVTVDYTTLESGGELDDEQFAWSPPMGARDAQAAANAREQMTASFAKLEGQPAPDFDLPTLDGKRIALADLKGDVILLDFWATWCGPCIKSMPHLEQLHKEKGPAGLKVLAIDVAESEELVRPFIEKNEYTFPVLMDTDSTATKAYGADKAIPYQVLIGRDGVVKKIVVGAGGTSQAAMNNAIHEALTSE